MGCDYGHELVCMSFMCFNDGHTIEAQRREGVLYSIVSNGTTQRQCP